MDNNYVIVFDGVCNLCNSTVDWVMRHDKRQLFKFASLQSAYGAQVKARFGLPADYSNSVLLVESGRLYAKSDAALRIAFLLGGFWKALSLLRVLPLFLRNPIYDIIARNRYAWFGKRNTCRLPTASEQSRFI